jgi:hypothetical protein
MSNPVYFIEPTQTTSFEKGVKAYRPIQAVS